MIIGGAEVIVFLFVWAALSWIGAVIGMIAVMAPLPVGSGMPRGDLIAIELVAIQGTIAFCAAAVLRALRR